MIEKTISNLLKTILLRKIIMELLLFILSLSVFITSDIKIIQLLALVNMASIMFVQYFAATDIENRIENILENKKDKNNLNIIYGIFITIIWILTIITTILSIMSDIL